MTYTRSEYACCIDESGVIPAEPNTNTRPRLDNCGSRSRQCQPVMGHHFRSSLGRDPYSINRVGTALHEAPPDGSLLAPPVLSGQSTDMRSKGGFIQAAPPTVDARILLLFREITPPLDPVASQMTQPARFANAFPHNSCTCCFGHFQRGRARSCTTLLMASLHTATARRVAAVPSFVRRGSWPSQSAGIFCWTAATRGSTSGWPTRSNASSGRIRQC